MEHIFLAPESEIREFISTLEFSEHEQLWDSVRSEIKENLSIILESFQVNSPCKHSDRASNDKKDIGEATERMHYLLDIVNFSYQYLQISTLRSCNMLEAMINLHDSLLFLPNLFDKIQQLKQIICKICIFFWVNDLSGAENLVTQSIPYLLMSSLQDDNHESNIKNLLAIREALFLFDFDDASSEFLIELILRCMICPRYLKNIDGRRFLSFLFSVDAGLHPFLMDTIKPQLALGNKSVSKAYGDILLRAWKELDEKNDKQKTFKGLIEDLIQELIHCAIHAEHQKYFIGLRSSLSSFHEAKRLKDVDKLLFRAYGPILWRSLQCANAVVRAQASALFFDAFPLQNPDANTVDTDTNLQKQFYFFHVLLNDEDHRVRAVAAAGVCHVLKSFWEIIPLQDIDKILRFIVLNLSFDSSWAIIRINTLKGLASLIDNPLTHLQLKVVLPELKAVMYDKSEVVCASFLQLLCTVSSKMDLPFIDIVPLQEIHSLLALKAHRPPIASRIIELLLPSYYPEKTSSDFNHDPMTATSTGGKSSNRSSASEQLRRCVEFIKQNEVAAVVFYGMFYQHSSVGRATKLAVMILSVLRKDAEIFGGDLRKKSSEIVKDLATKSIHRSKRGRGKVDVDDTEDDCISQDNKSTLNPVIRVGLFRVLESILLGIRNHLTSINYTASASLMIEHFTPTALGLILRTQVAAMTMISGGDCCSDINNSNNINPTATFSSTDEHITSSHIHELVGITLWIIKLMQSISTTIVTENDNDWNTNSSRSLVGDLSYNSNGNYHKILETVNSKRFIMDILCRNKCLTASIVRDNGEVSCSMREYNHTAYDLVLMVSTLEKQEMFVTLVTESIVSSLSSMISDNSPFQECQINKLGSNKNMDSSLDNNTTSRSKRRMSSTQGGLTALYAQETSTAVIIPLAHAILVLEELLQLPLTNTSKSSNKLKRTTLFAEYFENSRQEWYLSRAFDCVRKVVEFKLCNNVDQCLTQNSHATADEVCILRLVQIWFLYIVQKDLLSANAPFPTAESDGKSTVTVAFHSISLIHWISTVVIPKTGFIDDTFPIDSAAAATAALPSLASPIPPPKSKLRLRSPISLSAPMSDSPVKIPTVDTVLVPLAISILKIGLATLSDCLPTFGRLLRLERLPSDVKVECSSLLNTCIKMIVSFLSSDAIFPSSFVPVMIRLCKSMFTTDVIVHKIGATIPWPLLLKLLLKNYLQYAYDEIEGLESKRVRELLASIIRTSGVLKLSDRQYSAIGCCIRLIIHNRSEEFDDTNTIKVKKQKVKDCLQCLSMNAPVKTASIIQKLIHCKLHEDNYSDNTYPKDALQYTPILHLVEILVSLLLVCRENVSEPIKGIVNLIHNDLLNFLSSTTSTSVTTLDYNKSENRSNLGGEIIRSCSYEECLAASEFLKLYNN